MNYLYEQGLIRLWNIRSIWQKWEQGKLSSSDAMVMMRAFAEPSAPMVPQEHAESQGADDLWRATVQKHTKGGACNFRNAAFEFAENAIKDERESCAKLCDELGDGYMQQARGGDSSGASDHKACAATEISDAIRSR